MSARSIAHSAPRVRPHVPDQCRHLSPLPPSSGHSTSPKHRHSMRLSSSATHPEEPATDHLACPVAAGTTVRTGPTVRPCRGSVRLSPLASLRRRAPRPKRPQIDQQRSACRPPSAPRVLMKMGCGGGARRRVPANPTETQHRRNRTRRANMILPNKAIWPRDAPGTSRNLTLAKTDNYEPTSRANSASKSPRPIPTVADPGRAGKAIFRNEAERRRTGENR